MNRGVILIVDDDVDYACLLQVALLEAQVSNPIEILTDGCAAIEFLEKRYAGSRIEEDLVLVLLDLKMPRMGGLEVLHWLRGQPHLASVPVVVFTGMEAADELFRAHAAGATSVQVKPFAYRDLVFEAQNLRTSYLTPRALKCAA